MIVVPESGEIGSNEVGELGVGVTGVDVIVLVAVGVTVLVGLSVLVGVIVGLLGTYRRCPTTIVVELPRQLACCKAVTVVWYRVAIENKVSPRFTT